MKKICSLLAAGLMLAGSASAQSIFNKSSHTRKQSAVQQSANNTGKVWHAVASMQSPDPSLMRIHPLRSLTYTLDEAVLKSQMVGLSENPAEAAVISLPMPNGTFRDFRVWQTPMMPAELAAQYPEIKTFTAEAVNDHRVTAKLDFTLFGFHAMVFEASKISFIDPYDNLHDGYYIVHYKSDEQRQPWQAMHCEVKGEKNTLPSTDKLLNFSPNSLPSLDLKKINFDNQPNSAASGNTAKTTTSAAAKTSNGWTLRTYRIAVSANHEYCQAVTGLSSPTVGACLSAMTTTMNRVNGVYNREFSVQMNFVAAETSLIFPIATGDPFDGLNSNPSGCLTQNQTTCDGIIGNSNYDIGHVFTTDAGGLAMLGVVCNSSLKAQGVTGSSSPSGDGYDIDYVAHEIGHEFGSNHTFNNDADGSCNGNAVSACAYEPASGATIMDYAGICPPDDIQPHSDAYFSASSMQQICTALATSENVCAVGTPTGNKQAFVPALTTVLATPYTIPYKTPFELIGPVAVDSVADTATTYQWYQWNLGDFGQRLVNTFKFGPIFRSFQPVYNPTRVFPNIGMVFSGILSNAGTDGAEGEKAPDTARYLTFKMNVRTILAGKGCINQPDDTVHIDVWATGAANSYQGFKVTSQSTAVTYTGGSTQTVTWNVVGTNAAPVNAANVDIYMATDSVNWTLLGTFPNTGTASVTLPNPTTTTNTARIKVKGSGNIFFNVNGSNFTVTHAVTPVVGVISGPTSVCQGLFATYTDTSLGGTWSSSTPAVGSINSTTGVFNALTAGTTTITYHAPAGNVTLVVTVNAAPVAGTITGASTLCAGQTTTLADATGTPGGTWSSSNTSRATVDAFGTVTGVAAGAVNITYTATNSCGSVFAIHGMTINAAPVVAPIAGTLSACVGGTSSLTDATPLGVWSSTVSSVASISSGGTVTAGVPGTTIISYTVTSGSCSAAATAVFTSNAIPAASVSPSGAVTICSGGTVTLTAAPTGSYTYQWQESGFDLPGETAATFTTGTAGNYRVVVTSTAGCAGTSSVVNVTVSSSTVVVPSVSIAASPGLVICGTGTSVTFTANPVNGGISPAYLWTVNGAPVSSTGDTYTYIPANGDVIGVVLTSSSPCAVPTTAGTSVTMTVVAAVTPSVSIDPAPNDTVCAGGSVTYNAVPAFGGSAPVYQWNVNGIDVATGPSFTTAPVNGDIVMVTMTSNYTPCLTVPTAVSAPLTMTVEAYSVNSVDISASSTSIVAGEAITFVAIAPHGGTSPQYQWYINTTPVAGATNVTFTVSTLANGETVYCRVTTSDVCATPHAAMSGGLTVTVIPTSVWETTKAGNSFVLLPNPSKGTFSIKGRLSAGSDNNVAIIVNNMLGQSIYKGTAMAVNGSIDTRITLPADLASGTYFVNIISGGDNAVFHLIIER